MTTTLVRDASPIKSAMIVKKSPCLDNSCIDELHDLLAYTRVLHVVLECAWIALCLLQN
jgi:hypothetical protein